MIHILIMAALFVPQANDKTIMISPLNRGETAYINNGDGTAELKVGTDGVDSLEVFSRQGIRTYAFDQIDRSRYSYVASPIWRYDGPNDRWDAKTYPVASGTVHTITFQCPGNVKIDKFEYSSWGHGVNTIALDNGYDASYEILNNIVTLKIVTKNNLDSLYVYGIKIYTLRYGRSDYVNDFNDKKFIFNDSFGEECDFNGLREQLVHWYDGNRGEDWSDYSAKSPIRVGLHAMYFGENARSNDHFRVSANRLSANTLTVQKNMERAVEITDYTDGYTPSGSENFRVANCARTNTTAWITVNKEGISNFDYTKVTAYESNGSISGKDEVWNKAPLSYVSASGDYVTYTMQAQYALSMVRVQYGVASVLVNIGGILRANRLQLVGDDNIVYELHINGGVISATPAN